jgi:hypothetical protein
MMLQTYASPPAFKQALEQRLKSSSSSGVDFARRRQLLVFDRFLARIVAIFGAAALLKGGLALELRLIVQRFFRTLFSGGSAWPSGCCLLLNRIQ